MTTQTLTLAAFLLARLDEDEAVARAATPPCGAGTIGGWFVDTDEDGGYVAIDTDLGMYHTVIDKGAPDTLAHIARHDPARVLADVETKRRIVAEHDARDQDTALMLGPPSDRQRQWSGLRLTLRLLALPYADHEAYDPAWRP